MKAKQSKSLQIRDMLKSRLIDGGFQPGDRFLSQRQAMQEFGCAAMTAAKVFQMLEQEGLIRCTVGDGSFVNDLQTVSKTLGYVYNNSTSKDYPWLAKLLAGMQTACMDTAGVPHRLQIIGVDHDEAGAEDDEVDLRHAQPILDDLKNKKLDGLILGVRVGESVMEQLHAADARLVFLEGRTYPGDKQWPLIAIDLKAIAQGAVEHFHSHGYRRIGLIKAHGIGHTQQDLVTGYQHGLQQTKATDFHCVETCAWSVDDCMKHVLSLFQKPGPHPDALLCNDDIQAMGAMRARDQMNLTPSSLGIIGIGNLLPFGQEIGLSTFDTNIQTIGRLSVVRLLELIHGRRHDVLLDHYVESKLIARDSAFKV